MVIQEAYLEPSRASTMECFCEKSSIIDVRLYSKYASEYNNKFCSWRFKSKVNDILKYFFND